MRRWEKKSTDMWVNPDHQIYKPHPPIRSSSILLTLKNTEQEKSFSTLVNQLWEKQAQIGGGERDSIQT
jgi:hypothetical protein